MLVHICCSVDSHYFLQELRKVYPHEKMIGFFYNPNIHPKDEYDLRLLDVRRSCENLGIGLIVGDYDFMSWFEGVRGLEDAEEKGERCGVCFDERLLKTALLALEISENKITTTLLASPMKSRDELFLQGENIAKKYQLEFIKIDVRKDGGTQRQAKMAKDSNLYRQNYCGCQFALEKQRNRAGKCTFELFEHIGGQILPASAKQNLAVFIELNRLETARIPYILQKNQIQTYRILRAFVKHDNRVIPSYIFTHSRACKNLKSGKILWREIRVAWESCENLTLGFCDNAVFMTIEGANVVFNKRYQNTLEMLYNPPLYDDELRFRVAILGIESVKPVIVVDSVIDENISISIDSVFQNMDKFSLIKLEL